MLPKYSISRFPVLDPPPLKIVNDTRIFKKSKVPEAFSNIISRYMKLI